MVFPCGGLNDCSSEIYLFSGGKNSYEIFKYARNAIDPKVEFTRFDVPRAGLRLFARHATQFNQYLFDDYEVNTEKQKKKFHVTFMI